MKNKKLFLISMMVGSWLTVPFLGWKTIKRFLPASILLNLVVQAEFFLARKRRWWWFYRTRRFDGILPIYWGPFLVGSLWILKLTYGRTFLYMITNAIIDSLYAYPGVIWFRKLKIASLVRISRFQFLSLLLFNAFLLYVFQAIKEKMDDS